MIENRPTHSVKHQTVCFTRDAMKRVKYVDDFYQNTGIAQRIVDREIDDVCQIWMNQDQCEALKEIMIKEHKRTGKRRGRSSKMLEMDASMNWVCYSPVSVPYVPEGEIWIFKKEDKTTAMTEFRDWVKQSQLEGMKK